MPVQAAGRKRDESSAASRNVVKAQNKKAKNGKQSYVYLVFLEEERGGTGNYGGCGYDNGSHSAKLLGVYTSRLEAKRHADYERSDEDDGSATEDADDSDGIQSSRRCVSVVKAPISSSFKPDGANLWSFEADTTLEGDF